VLLRRERRVGAECEGCAGAEREKGVGAQRVSGGFDCCKAFGGGRSFLVNEPRG
jgi:hypothetical protein